MADEGRVATKPGTSTDRRRGSSAARLYAFGVALVLFFVSWSAIAARPWQEKSAKKADPRVLALTAREKQLRGEALVLQRKLKRQWALYEQSLELRQSQIAAARLQHEQAVAAAAAAAAAAARASRSTAATSPAIAVSTRAPAPGSSPSPTPPPAPAHTPEPPPPVVVQLPPEVIVVELPPVTTSSSS